MAANYSNNWVNDKINTTESGRRAAEKANKLEKKRIKDGWRWIRLSPRTTVFVPCDKDGNPTGEGQKIIEAAKRNYV